VDDEHSDYKVVDEADIAEEDRTSPIQIQTGGYDRYLFVLLFILCFFSNGFMPSIATFVSMPYGIQAFHASTITSTMMNPVACIIATYKPIRSRLVFNIFFGLTMALTGFNLYLALSSPCPVLVDTMGGSTLMVITTSAFMLTTTLLKVSFASILRDQQKSRRLLLWFGAITQIGSFFGAITCYPLVNSLNIFRSRYACQPCPTV